MLSEGESTEQSSEEVREGSSTWKVRKRVGSKVISRAESNVIKAYSSSLPAHAPPARPQTAVPRRRRPSCGVGRTGQERTQSPRIEKQKDGRLPKRPKSAKVRRLVSQRSDLAESEAKRRRAPLSMKEIRNVRLELDNFVGHFTVGP